MMHNEATMKTSSSTCTRNRKIHRERLTKIMSCIGLLAGQDLTLCGRNEDRISSRVNLYQLMLLLAEDTSKMLNGF